MSRVFGSDPPEMGITGMMCSWGLLIGGGGGVLVCGSSVFIERKRSGITRVGGDSGFWDGELELLIRRGVLQFGELNRVVPQFGESNEVVPQCGELNLSMGETFQFEGSNLTLGIRVVSQFGESNEIAPQFGELNEAVPQFGELNEVVPQFGESNEVVSQCGELNEAVLQCGESNLSPAVGS